MAAETSQMVVQIPWAAIITAITSLVGAFGGLFFSNKANEKKWGKQIEYEKEKDRRSLLRTKGEEAFLNLKKWERELYWHYGSRVSFFAGNITADEMLSNDEKYVDHLTHSNFSALISLYFTALSDDLKNINASIKKANEVIDEAQELGGVQASKKLAEACTNFSKEIEIFAIKLRDAILSI
ncbi:hypothetical protein [Erwinia rhapontici]|uniref:hypothetical protein n=1 Tax=Erwinia rhapontici TaxID=55212 RepID=UPI002167C002|nr:hypothetical protein [Erwinia rhapontici]MCS3605312.1 hypothetical protein [Erwinia rhapontici]